MRRASLLSALLALLWAIAPGPAPAATPSGNGNGAVQPKTAAAPPKATPVKPRPPASKQAAVAPSARTPATVPPTPTAAGPVLRLAVEGAYPPFSEVDAKGRLKGFDVEIANALCAELAVRCQLVQRPWAVLQDAVLGLEPQLWNEVDAIVASVSITDSRRRTADFTRRYYQVPARFLRRKGSGVEPVAGGLQGRRIGVQASTTHDQFATQRFGGEAEIVRFETLPQAVAALRDGRVDLVLADALALDRGVLKTREGAGLELCGPNFTDPQWFGHGAGIAVKKGNRELVERLDAALDRIRAKGEHARIARAYFGFDIDPR
jgi:arginine/ornithine transport system substrate-binding protein